MTSYKTCAVPKCQSTTIKCPKKLFIHVPKCPKRRKQWLRLARRDPQFTSDKSAIFFCEDHFDLPNDMENYIQYSIMGSIGKIKMKPDCLPTKFYCQPDGIKRTEPPKHRSVVSKRRRMDTLEEIFSKEMKIEEDMINFIQYKIMKGKQKTVIKLKKGIVPHKFQCQIDNKTQLPRERKQMFKRKHLKTIDGSPCKPPANSSLVVAGEDEDGEETASEDEFSGEVELKSRPDDDWSCSPLAGEEQDDKDMVEVKAEQEDESEIVVKEEFFEFHEHPPEEQLENYKTLYFKIKEELSSLKIENQRLADENQMLNANLHNFTDKIEKLLKEHEKHKKNSDQQIVKESENVDIKKLKIDKCRLAEENKSLANKIEAVLKQNHIQMKEIQELTEKNRRLSVKIQELVESNQRLAAAIQSAEVSDSEKAEDGSVLVQDVQSLSEDVRRLGDDNERLRRRILLYPMSSHAMTKRQKKMLKIKL